MLSVEQELGLIVRATMYMFDLRANIFIGNFSMKTEMEIYILKRIREQLQLFEAQKSVLSVLYLIFIFLKGITCTVQLLPSY